MKDQGKIVIDVENVLRKLGMDRSKLADIIGQAAPLVAAAAPVNDNQGRNGNA